jgi:hypothetical protein
MAIEKLKGYETVAQRLASPSVESLIIKLFKGGLCK